MSRIPPALMTASTVASCAGEFTICRAPPRLYPGERALLGLVLPPFQRPAVWDVERQRKFVESLFLGLNSTAIVVTDNEWGDDGRRLPKTSWIIDGQQRLTALAAFLAGDLAIFDGVRHGHLDAQERRRLDDAPLARIKISYRTPERDLKTLYERLAFGGLAHTEEHRARLA